MVASQKILRFWSEDDPDYGLTETMEGRRNARPTLYVKVTLFQSFTIPNSANLLDGGRARLCDRIAGEPVQWLTHVTKRRFQAVARLEGPLDREHSVLGGGTELPPSQSLWAVLRNPLFIVCSAAPHGLARRGPYQTAQ